MRARVTSIAMTVQGEVSDSRRLRQNLALDEPPLANKDRPLHSRAMMMTSILCELPSVSRARSTPIRFSA
jgi:hypothetical protein